MMLTEGNIARHLAETERIDKEHAEIRNAADIFNQRFTHLELSLSALLYSILNLQNSRLAYAIYYSPTSFDARAELVGNCILQIASENKQLEEIGGLWNGVDIRLQQVRRLRNALAHGAPITLSINNKRHVRFTAPAFDVIRVGRKIDKRQIPGLTISDISGAASRLVWLSEAIDHFNRLIAEFYDGNPSLLEKFGRLKRHLSL
jgi:hypothetical protein